VLLDIGSVLGGVGLAVLGFVVVILVCVVILRLLAAFLPSYEDRSVPAVEEPAEEAPTLPIPDHDPVD
jgi:K+-transporting ATPase A subunit